MQKCDFCVSVCKANFTDHHTPDAIHGFRDSVLVCTMHNCYYTISKNFEHFYSLPSSDASDCIIKCNYAVIKLAYEKKPLQNAFKCI